jgi:cyclohexyl-isocyanide hydratase
MEASPMAQPFRIVFILYPRLTQLDFTGPYEVLARVPNTDVVIASKGGGVLKTEMGLTFTDLAKLSDVASADMIMIPGGPGQTEAMQDASLHGGSEAPRCEGAKYVTSASAQARSFSLRLVCSPASAQAATGLTANLLAMFGAIPDDARVVRDGNVITGGGVTAGIDIALTIAAELAGEDVAKMIQLAIEYAPAPPFNCRTARDR